MIRLLSSFYVRLSVFFLLLLILVGAIYVLFAVRSSIDFVEEADQKMNAHLAESIAAEIRPMVRDSIETAEIGHLLHYLMVMNPHVEIYILDSTGNILAFFADQSKQLERTQVALDPIRQFLTEPLHGTVKGIDPRSADREKPFSVSTIELKNGAQGYVYVILGGEQYDQAAAAIRQQFMTSTIVLGLFIALLSTAALGIVLFFVMTKRLRRMESVVAGFKDGNLTQRLEDNSRDDFGRLALAFNQMADTILENIKELKHSDDLRREMVANVSHDLRTPLVLIQGYLETIAMKADHLSPDELQRYMTISLQNARYLNKLVSDLFELSKLNAIHVKPVREPFSITDLVQDVIMKFRSSAEAKQIEIDCNHQQQLPLVTGDIGLIERALSNLLDNAIRYAPERARVQIDLIQSGDQIRIQIADSGPGIHHEDIPLIFLPYHRGRNQQPRDSQGTGLGLAITKRIVELHGSDIHVDSEQGKGTVFYFNLARA